MLKPTIGVVPEGTPYIWLAAFCAVVAAILGWTPVAVLLTALTLFVGHFFRDPERVGPEDASAVVSPADGKIVKISEESDPLTGERKQVVCVFMNVFNVHVNRMPVAGTVRSIRYIPGKFLNASLDKASKDNERCLLGIDGPDGKSFTVVQIAGLIARRIVCRAQQGDGLGRGERFGLIKFGSRVDLYIPAGYDICVTHGDKVIAGETPLAVKKQPGTQR